MRRLGEALLDRLIAADPGRSRLRLGCCAVLGLAVAVALLALLGQPQIAIVIAGMNAMSSNFIVKDRERHDQAGTLALMVLVGAVSIAFATLDAKHPLVNNTIFVLLIFIAVYAQRFGPRGSALGGTAFFSFLIPSLLHATAAQLPAALLGLVAGLGVHALVRFVVWPQHRVRELRRTQYAVRYWLSRVVTVSARMLVDTRSDRLSRQLERTWTRLHESGLAIEELLADDSGRPVGGGRPGTLVRDLQENLVEIELAAQRLSMATTRAATCGLSQRDRFGLSVDLDRLGALIDQDPVARPVISGSPEFQLLTEIEPTEGESSASWQVRQSVAELAAADASAQRLLLSLPAMSNSGTSDPTTGDESAEAADHERGLARWIPWDTHARQSLQALVGGGLAVFGGELLSPQRWYWAVLTVMVVFLGTNSRGQALLKGFNRVLGTLVGIGGGVLVASLAGGNFWILFALLLVCVFCLVYMASVSQTLMSFFITTSLGLMYSLLGMFTVDVLWLRLGETAIGATAALVAAIVVVPIRTRTVVLADLVDLLKQLRTYVDVARRLLSGEENVSLIAESREVDRLLDHLRTTVEPLTHRFSPFRQQRDGSWYVLALLGECAAWVRRLAWESEPAELGPDDRLRVTADRLIRTLDDLIDEVEGTRVRPLSEAVPAGEIDRPLEQDLRVRSLLGYLERIEVSVTRLARQLGQTPSGGA